MNNNLNYVSIQMSNWTKKINLLFAYISTLPRFYFVFLSASKRRGHKLIEAIGETIKLYFAEFVLVIGVPSLPDLLQKNVHFFQKQVFNRMPSLVGEIRERPLAFARKLCQVVFSSLPLVIGPESDHWLPLSVTHLLIHLLTYSRLGEY